MRVDMAVSRDWEWKKRDSPQRARRARRETREERENEIKRESEKNFPLAFF
jgi:hypothetical protein